MSTLYKNGQIYVSDQKRFVCGSVAVDNGFITQVFLNDDCVIGDFDETVELNGARVAPGLIDAHTHGRDGGDFCLSDADSIRAMSDSYLNCGTTSVMATLASAPIDVFYEQIDNIANVAQSGDSVYIGIHLEGRYLNPKKRGAHAKYLLAAPNAGEIKALINKMKQSGYVHVSAALELDADGNFTAAVLDQGATLGLAHSDATYAQGQIAFERGATALTHTYNAMSPFHHRDGGAVGAGLLTDGVYCELICDGFHVSPEAVRMAYALKGDKIVLVTDSMAGTNMPDGEYSIAGMGVVVKDGKARTLEGAIAGSTLTLIDGVKNLASFACIRFEDALYCATASPAKMLGAYGEIGSIDHGKRANMIILNEDNSVSGVIFRGVKI